MDQPAWLKPPPPEQRRCFRQSADKNARSRLRGLRRGTGKRWHLRNLPPIEDDPELDQAGALNQRSA